MALVDHQYKFTYIDVGEYGSNSDSNVFRNLNLGTRFMQGHLDVLAPKALPNFPNMGDLPHCLDLMRLGDEAVSIQLQAKQSKKNSEKHFWYPGSEVQNIQQENAAVRLQCRHHH